MAKLEKEKFEKILNSVVKRIAAEGGLSTLTDRSFEKRIYQELLSYFDKTEIEYKEGSTSFPDIGLPPYGIEVKSTEGDTWVCLGNSIMEGTRKSGVKNIYVLFLKKGGNPEIKWKKYEDCISDIKVTHSPRYEVNMDIEDPGESVLNKIGITYSDFSADPNKIPKLREYYKKHKKNSNSWWIDPETGESVTSMRIESFGGLSSDRKEKLIVELFAFFPEIIRGDYHDAAVYLITRYGVYDKSFRDKFSAGGQEPIEIGNDKYKVPKVIKRILKYLPLIEKYLKENKGQLSEFWGYPLKNGIDPFDEWLNLLNRYSKSEDICDGKIRIKNLLLYFK